MPCCWIHKSVQSSAHTYPNIHQLPWALNLLQQSRLLSKYAARNSANIIGFKPPFRHSSGENGCSFLKLICVVWLSTTRLGLWVISLTFGVSSFSLSFFHDASAGIPSRPCGRYPIQNHLSLDFSFYTNQVSSLAFNSPLTAALRNWFGLVPFTYPVCMQIMR